MGSYKEASIDYEMLKGCVNRIFVTDDMDELPHLYASAVYHLGDIYKYGMERLRKRNEDTADKDSPAGAACTDQDAGSDT